MALTEAKPGFEAEMEYVMDELYEHRKYALDPDCTWNVRP